MVFVSTLDCSPLQVGGSLSDYPLTASEFIHIAEQAVAMSEYAIALQWLQQVLVHEHDVTSAVKLKSTLLQAIIYEKVKLSRMCNILCDVFSRL